MKEKNEINKKLSPDVAVKTAALTRDYQNVANDILTKFKRDDINVLVEAYNFRDMLRDPDTVGVTVCYPLENPTHVLTKECSLSVGEVQFGKDVETLINNIISKIPKE